MVWNLFHQGRPGQDSSITSFRLEKYNTRHTMKPSKNQVTMYDSANKMRLIIISILRKLKLAKKIDN